VIETRVSKAGYAVQTAADGVDAVNAHAPERPDLVLSDVTKPDMDGQIGPHAEEGAHAHRCPRCNDVCRRFAARSSIPCVLPKTVVCSILVEVLCDVLPLYLLGAPQSGSDFSSRQALTSAAACAMPQCSPRVRGPRLFDSGTGNILSNAAK
jgi:hypothetical protein